MKGKSTNTTKEFDFNAGRYERHSISNISKDRSNNAKQKTGLWKKLKGFFSVLFRLFEFFAAIAGLLLLAYLILQMRVFSSKLETVFELQNIIANLKASSPIVRLQLIDAEKEERRTFSRDALKEYGLKTFKVSYFNASGEIEDDEAENISITGKNIYVDCDVYNFTYSLIESGEAQNIAIPFRMYSDIVAPENGILLNAKNERNIPFALLKTSELASADFYQLQNKRLTKLMEILNDPKRSKELGIIRTRQRAAVANYDTMQVGKTYTVIVENTGGLTFKSK